MRIDAPGRAEITLERLAQGVQDAQPRLLDGRRFRQDLRDAVLRELALLAPLALGDVDRERDGEKAPAAVESSRPDLDGKDASVLAPPQVVERRIPVLAQPPPNPLDLFRREAGIELDWMHADELFARIAQGLACLAVHVAHDVLVVEEVKGVGRLVDERPEPLLARAQLLLARQQVAVREHARQRVVQAPGDLLEEPALRGSPHARMRALVQPEQVRPVPLGANCNRDGRSDPEPLADFRGSRIGIAGINQPGAIGTENGQRLLEHAAHHVFHVVRALQGAVDPVHALEEPHVLPSLFFGALLLRDVHDGADVLDDLAGAAQDWMRHATDCARSIGEIHQSIFRLPVAARPDRLVEALR